MGDKLMEYMFKSKVKSVTNEVMGEEENPEEEEKRKKKQQEEEEKRKREREKEKAEFEKRKEKRHEESEKRRAEMRAKYGYGDSGNTKTDSKASDKPAGNAAPAQDPKPAEKKDEGCLIA